MRAVRYFLVLLLLCLAIISVRAEAEDEFEDDDDVVEPRPTPGTRRYQTVLGNESPKADGKRSIQWSQLNVWDFQTEALILGGLVLYVISYYYGRRKNNQIARNWMRITLPIWERNFAQVGDEGGHKLIRDGPRDYIFYATGRAHVKHVSGSLHLAGRYDILQWIVDYLQPQQAYDKMTFTVTLNEKESDPTVFAILQKNLANSVIKERWDLSEFSKRRDVGIRQPPAPKEYTIMADTGEFVTNLWDEERIREKLWGSLGVDQNGKGEPLEPPMLEQIILTDLPKTKPTKVEELREAPKTLTFVLRLPNLANLNAKHRDAITSVTELLIDMVDYIGQFGSVTAEAKAKLVKLRQAAEQVILRSQEDERKVTLAQKKMQEKKERDEQAAKLSPEGQRKYEERERKKQAKKAQSKRMKKGKVIMG
ncbi:hypothetical protein SpCBS45565_g01872 [Spizellomyces sp. 'palustris']|nr:hypothetical protein SpCBS45565_g01872 [Spizellomyces sp. 'palustris']